MAKIEIDTGKCAGCEACVGACPVGMFAMEDGKVKIVKDVNECAECHACESVCPNGAIKIL
ncbi:MAG: 4Fe-4S binding protein [Candidatus Altarchaeaceae archaeon]